jgi:hypothetical protein
VLISDSAAWGAGVVNEEYTGHWQIPGYWYSLMLLVEPVVDEMVVKAAGHVRTSILAPATSDPCCAQSRSSVVARLWRAVMTAFCCRLRVRNIARVSQSQVMNARASGLSNSIGCARTHPATRHWTQLQVSVPVSCLA